MQPEDVPANANGSETCESDTHGPTIGHILHERFLVERDMTDQSLGGGFSVFLVKDLKNYCREAVLKISRPVFNDAGVDGPSLKEVSEVLTRLAHPNIEEILETGRFADGLPFALTRPYAMATLDQLIEPEKRLELESVAQLVEQIVDGLAAAHSKGILHCDLRPANILVPAGDVGANNIKIVNFGAAWPIDVRGESLIKVQPGSESIHYAAPELLVKLGHRSPASDIYSLAVLVYRLVTGALPYVAFDRAAMLESINAGAAKSPGEYRTDLSGQAEELMMTALQFEPAWRPQDLGDFGLRLVRLLKPPKGIPVVQPQEPSELEFIPEKTIQPEIAPYLGRKETRPLPVQPADIRAPLSDRTVTWALIILLMAGALSIPIGQTIFKEKGATAAAINTMAGRPIEHTAYHQIRYWSEPQGFTGKNSFAGGQFAFLSDTPGDAYVFTEFTGEDERPAYELIYPSSDSGAKRVEAGKPIKVTPVPDRQQRAIWIVWTAVRHDDLESICSSAQHGAISDENQRRKLRHFLERNRNLRVEVSSDPSNAQTILDGFGDKIVHRIEISGGGS
jgi:hypothetical protein